MWDMVIYSLLGTTPEAMRCFLYKYHVWVAVPDAGLVSGREAAHFKNRLPYPHRAPGSQAHFGICLWEAATLLLMEHLETIETAQDLLIP